MATNDQFVGIVSTSFLRGSVGSLDLGEPLTIAEEDSVAGAIRLLQQHNVGCVAVVDAQGVLTGVFTERDILKRVVGQTTDPERTPVSQLMTPKPHTIQMTTKMGFALNMMAEGGYRHLPVVDEHGAPIAVLSVRDLIRQIARTITDQL